MNSRFLKNRSKILIGSILTLISSLLLSACGRSGGLVSRPVDTILFYQTKENQTIKNHQYRLRINYGNPNDLTGYLYYENPEDENNPGNVSELNKITDPEKKLKASFFTNIVSGALKYQKYAILARSDLLKTYYTYSTNKQLNNTIELTDKNAIEKYLVQQSTIENLTANDNAFASFQFAFAISNILKQGNGFSGHPQAIQFDIDSIYFNLGDLSAIKFQTFDKKSFVVYQKPTTSNSTQNNSDNLIEKILTINNQAQKFVKFNVKSSSYNFRFKRYDNNQIITSNVIENYFNAQGNNNLIPKKFQKFTNTNFNISLANYAIWANVIDPETIMTSNKNNSTSQTTTNTNLPSETLNIIGADNLAWNNLANQDKLFDDSIIKLTNQLSPDKFFNVNDRALVQNTYSHFINTKLFFPNNKLISSISTTINAFKNVDPSNNLIDWSNLKKLQVNDLLFSFFPDFQFSSNYDNVEKSKSSTNSNQWLNHDDETTLKANFKKNSTASVK